MSGLTVSSLSKNNPSSMSQLSKTDVKNAIMFVNLKSHVYFVRKFGIKNAQKNV